VVVYPVAGDYFKDFFDFQFQKTKFGLAKEELAFFFIFMSSYAKISFCGPKK
jgi:hypothetical protein